MPISEALKGKYKVVGQMSNGGKMYSVKHSRHFDFSRLTLKEADMLFAEGSPYLEKVVSTPKKSTTDSKSNDK